MNKYLIVDYFDRCLEKIIITITIIAVYMNSKAEYYIIIIDQ